MKSIDELKREVKEKLIKALDEEDTEKGLKYNKILEIIISKEKDIEGVILIWKGVGGKVSRNYVKVNAVNRWIATKLLTVLLWERLGDLYAKIKKNSNYLKIFKEKLFGFAGYRGEELLLYRKKFIKKRANDNSNNYRNKSKVFNRR